MFRRFPSLTTLTAAFSAAVLLPACIHNEEAAYAEQLEQTRNSISPQLQQLGARNWIIIADPSYPIPAGTGTQTMVVPAGSADTFREVLDLIEVQGALTPRIWVCNEMEAVTDDLAPGMAEYNKQIASLTSGRFCYRLDERIISSQVADAARNFRVLFIKTTTQLPYSAIAIELDSGYWSSDAETEIRKRLEELQPESQPQKNKKSGSSKKRR